MSSHDFNCRCEQCEARAAALCDEWRLSARGVHASDFDRRAARRWQHKIESDLRSTLEELPTIKELEAEIASAPRRMRSTTENEEIVRALEKEILHADPS